MSNGMKLHTFIYQGVRNERTEGKREEGREERRGRQGWGEWYLAIRLGYHSSPLLAIFFLFFFHLLQSPLVIPHYLSSLFLFPHNYKTGRAGRVDPPQASGSSNTVEIWPTGYVPLSSPSPRVSSSLRSPLSPLLPLPILNTNVNQGTLGIEEQYWAVISVNTGHCESVVG